MIVSTSATPSNPAALPHDPDVCGLGGAGECNACRLERQRVERDFYQRDADAKERARRREIGRRFADATGITLDELADALLPIMAKGTAEIASAVMDERGAA